MRLRERIAQAVIKQCTDSVIGSHSNSVVDGLEAEMPSKEQMAKQIYDEVLYTKSIAIGGVLLEVKDDIKFLTKDTLMELINTRIDKVLSKQ